MIKKLSGRLMYAFLLILTVLFTGKVTYSQTKQDTFKLARVLLMHSLDSVSIGPEYPVTENTAIIREYQLPCFSEVLNQFGIPFKGKVISKFGIRHGRMHTGTDLRLNLGDSVCSAFEGIVTRASRYYGYGNLVIINHSHGLETYYAHFSKILVHVGDTLQKGKVVGLGGRTGRATAEHLHFEIRENGKAYNPELVYDFGNFSIRPEISGTEALAELVHNPKTGESVHITAKGNSYVLEMSTVPIAEYVIKTGDSLWEIARKFNTSVALLCEQNNLTTRSTLKIGKVLKIFGPADH
jgi:murein DD-endopeptidase MepM/ murein hydrolase activator NlpD